MQRYDKFSPTSFDHNIDINRAHWLVLEVSHNRDSDCLAESNWTSASEQLQADETPGCEIHRFGHWGPGWFEIILIHPWRKDLISVAEDIERALANYPVLDDSDYSEREQEVIEESWESFGYTDLGKSLADSIGAPDHADIEYDQHEVRSIVESQYNVISEHDSDRHQVERKLDATPDEILWKHVKAVEYLREDFEQLPFVILCTIARQGIRVTDYETTEPLLVPSYIWSAINPNQLELTK